MADRQTTEFLINAGLNKYVDTFEKAEITYDVLFDLTENRLVSGNLITATGALIKFSKALEKAQNQTLPSVSADQPQFVQSITPEALQVALSQASENSCDIPESITSSELFGGVCEIVYTEPSTSTSQCDFSESIPDASQTVSTGSGAIVPELLISACQVTDKPSTTQKAAKKSFLKPVPDFLQNYTLALAPAETIVELKAYLEGLLNQTIQGKSIICAFNLNKVNGAVRKNLVKLILLEEINSSAEKKISPARFKYIALAITALFPDESKSSYYIPQVSLGNKKKRCAGGMLYQSYLHMRTSFRKSGYLPPGTSRARNQIEVENNSKDLGLELTDELRDALQWLEKMFDQPYQVYSEKWKTTASYRLKQLHSTAAGSESAYEYFTRFKVLQKPYGHQLISSDFETLYPGKKDCLINVWPLLKSAILDLCKRRCKTTFAFRKFIGNEFPSFTLADELSELEQTSLALGILPCLFNPAATKGKGRKQSRKEVKDDFLVEFATLNDKATFLNLRKERLRQAKQSTQPFVCIVDAEEDDEDPQCCVTIDNTTYHFKNPLTAVDCCFKCCMVLNNEYSRSSAHVWLFIQKFVFNIETPFDPRITADSETVAVDLKLHCKA